MNCPRCNEEKGQSIRFKKKKTICYVCKREVDQVLDLHHTSKDLCSLKCEEAFWLNVFD